eukprot:3625347-Rhodomonas_salina.3
MSGTDLAHVRYRATHSGQQCDVRRCLVLASAMSSTRCWVPALAIVPGTGLGDVRCARDCYAMSGTDAGYAATEGVGTDTGYAATKGVGTDRSYTATKGVGTDTGYAATKGVEKKETMRREREKQAMSGTRIGTACAMLGDVRYLHRHSVCTPTRCPVLAYHVISSVICCSRRHAVPAWCMPSYQPTCASDVRYWLSVGCYRPTCEIRDVRH